MRKLFLLIANRKTILISAILIFLVAPVKAEENFTNEIETADGFSVYLPSGWVQIPADVIKQYSDSIQKKFPEAANVVFDYGFQKEDTENWFQYPYILIQVQNTGRISEEQIKKLVKTMPSLSKDVRQKLSRQDSLDSLKTFYDPENRILWNITPVGTDVAEVLNAQAMIFTNKNLIIVHQYSTAVEFLKYQSLFFEFPKKIQLEESFKYKPQITDGIPFLSGVNLDKAIEKGLVGGIIGGILVALAVFFRKRNNKKKGSS